ncbi:uncharacterized protein LOC132204424 [Neocloeon triangulifer]|uniref:uncharacterized protein LOC132204424 n=1 Tax=Neocloeon triangulifer TaxID=2078957 RepID=UPI00286F64B3|nr:uncharacterized protein LOC132204424 [Neocloeon triangulifer]
MKVHAATLLLLGTLAALAAAQDPLDAAYRFVQACGPQDLSMCLKQRALNFVDDALSKGDIPILSGVTLLQTANPSERTGKEVNDIPRNDENPEAHVESLLIDRVARFFSTHTLQVKVPDDTISDLKRSIEEGRKKKKKFLLPFLLALKLKAVALVPLVLGAIALLALKALVVGKIALALSALIGLQKLLANQHSTKTVEVVAHPSYSHEEHHSTGGHGHYARNIELPYSAHKP